VSGHRLWRLGWSILVAFSAASRAVAEPAHAAHIEWLAPASCPSVETLRSAVGRLLGESLHEGSALEAKAQVSHDNDDRFTLVLSIKTAEGEGTRSVRADTCSGVLDIAAFSIALAINPELDAPRPPEASAPAPEKPEPEPEAPPMAAIGAPHEATPPSEPAAATPPTELWFGAAGVLDSSLMPSPAWGLRGFGDVRLAGKLRLGLSGELFLPQTREIPGGGGDFSLWLLGAHACYQTTLGVPFAGCATFEAGRLSGEGRGVPDQLRQRSPLWLPGASLVALPALSRSLTGVVGVSGRFPVQRDRFVVKAGQLLRVPAFSLEVWAGIAFRAL